MNDKEYVEKPQKCLSTAYYNVHTCMEVFKELLDRHIYQECIVECVVDCKEFKH